MGDPAQTTPWLIYFIILTLTLLAESWTLFIIGWMPFYSWFRLFFLLYLVLPQTQGAKLLYLTYFEPFIIHHEKQIDQFIGQTHQRLEQVGLGYMNVVIEWIREKVLGQSSPQPHSARTTPAGAQGYATYATDLLSRFAMPAARTNAAPAVNSGGVLNMLSVAGAALGAGAATASGNTRGVPASAQAASMPDNFLSNLSSMSSDQKSTFLSTQRDRLNTMLRALDKEQQSFDLAYGAEGTSRPSGSRRPPSSHSQGGGLSTKSQSTHSFDNIDYDDLHSTGNGSHSGNGSGYPSQHSTPPTMRQSSGQGRPAASGNWASGNLGGWLGGNPREDEHERRERMGGSGDGEDDLFTRGFSTARDMVDNYARNNARERYDR